MVEFFDNFALGTALIALGGDNLAIGFDRSSYMTKSFFRFPNIHVIELFF